MLSTLRRLISAGTFALALSALCDLGHAHEDPRGDVYPVVQIEDGKFVVYFRNNTEPKIEVSGEPAGQNTPKEPVYKTVVSPTGTILEKRVPIQSGPSLFPAWMKRLLHGDPFGVVIDREKKPLLPAEWPDGLRPHDLEGITIQDNLAYFYFTGGKDERFRIGAYDLDQKKLLQSATIGRPGRIYSFARASEVIARDKEAWIAWIEERNVKVEKETLPDGTTADFYSSDTQVVVSRWNLAENQVTHLPVRRTSGNNVYLSLNRIGDHLLVAWHEGIGLSNSQILIEHIDLSTAAFAKELPLLPFPNNGL